MHISGNKTDTKTPVQVLKQFSYYTCSHQSLSVCNGPKLQHDVPQLSMIEHTRTEYLITCQKIAVKFKHEIKQAEKCMCNATRQVMKHKQNKHKGYKSLN